MHGSHTSLQFNVYIPEAIIFKMINKQTNEVSNDRYDTERDYVFRFLVMKSLHPSFVTCVSSLSVDVHTIYGAAFRFET